MSEQIGSRVGLSAEQQIALQGFQRRFGRVEALISTCLFGFGGFFVIALRGYAQSIGWLLWLGVGLILCAAVYPLRLFVVTKSRTGLMWHTLDAHPGVLARPVYCLLTFIWLVPLVRGEIAGSSVTMAIVGLTVLNIFLGIGIMVFSQRRAQLEREHYGDHWLELGALSFRDIFLLRIPHERA